MKEEEAKQRCQQRAAAQRAASGQAPAAAASVSGSFTASSFSARSAGSFLGAQNGPKEKLSLGRIMSERMSGLSGPDTSSWSALWSSLMESALGHQAMPLLQVGRRGQGGTVQHSACHRAAAAALPQPHPAAYVEQHLSLHHGHKHTSGNATTCTRLST